MCTVRWTKANNHQWSVIVFVFDCIWHTMETYTRLFSKEWWCKAVIRYISMVTQVSSIVKNCLSWSKPTWIFGGPWMMRFKSKLTTLSPPILFTLIPTLLRWLKSYRKENLFYFVKKTQSALITMVSVRHMLQRLSTHFIAIKIKFQFI